MKIVDCLKKETLLIIPSSMRKQVVKEISNNKQMFNIKYMSIEEFFCEYFYKVKDEALYYLMDKYNYNYDMAKNIIGNLYYVNESFDDLKLQNIKHIKNDLEKNNLLEFNPLFKEFVKSKSIIVYGYDYLDQFQLSVLNTFDDVAIIEKEEKEDRQTKLYEFQNIEDEVLFVANSICDLLNKNIDINKIKIVNINEEYYPYIKRIFSMFNIPYEIKDEVSVYETEMGQYFLNNLSTHFDQTFEAMSNKFTLENEKNKEIYNKIINICNKYLFAKNLNIIKQIFKMELRNTFVDKEKLLKKVEITSLKNNVFNDEHYVFLMSFNQGDIPIIYKDEDYLSDKQKNILNIDTSLMLNLKEKDSTLKNIKNIKNLVITYKQKSENKDCYISNLNDMLNLKIEKCFFDYYNSNIYNKILLASFLDEKNKYGTIKSNFHILNSNYDIDYLKYDNSFTGIEKLDLYKYLDNKLLLSYSSIDNYFKCGFKYYLSNILKINKYEETFMTVIGNIFHGVLQEAFNDNFDFDKSYELNTLKSSYEFNEKEKFFLEKLKQELIFVINTIKEQMTYSLLNDALYEQKVYVNKDKNIKVTFMGIIDKLNYKKTSNKTYVVIIDYKTGNPNINLNNIIYGLDMQLPLYIYLSKNMNIENVEVVGFYLQKILNNEINKDYKHSYEDLKKENLKLSGYSNSKIDVISMFDNNYKDSKVIKSLKTTEKGFYSYSKILNSEQIDKLSDLVSSKIDEARDNILEANFSINPKKINDKNKSCEFCEFRDVCYVKNKDFINLREYKTLEFLGGDDNA